MCENEYRVLVLLGVLMTLWGWSGCPTAAATIISSQGIDSHILNCGECYSAGWQEDGDGAQPAHHHLGGRFRRRKEEQVIVA